MTTDRVIYQATEHLKLLKEYVEGCMDPFDRGLMLMKIQAGIQNMLDDACPDMFGESKHEAAKAMEHCVDQLERVHRRIKSFEN